jgi:phosphodiesterase/alkaline phosphatase D-like protein
VGTRYTRTGTYTLRGLAPSTQYFYRVVAENQKDHIAGKTIYFTTKSFDTPAEAVVIAQTRGVTSLKDTGVTMHGYVAPHTGSARYWFEWGTDKNVGELTSDHAANRDGGEVMTELHGLIPGSTYYYRIAAENDRGVVRGTIQNFKTTGVKPVEETKKNQTAGTVDTKTNTTRSANNGTTGGLFGSFGGS